MSVVLMYLVAFAAVAVGGFVYPLPVPFSWLWATAIGALAFLAGVQWSAYTIAKDPEKMARLVAKYLPVDEIKALIGTGGFGDMIVNAAKKAGVILRE
jgi:hypothetical protein